jgi:hypothetical protein
MRKVTIIVLLAIIFASCARGITTYEAANGKARCGRGHQYIK